MEKKKIRKSISKKFQISIILNFIMFFMLCFVAYYKRDSIKNRIIKLIPNNNQQKIEKLALDMNTTVIKPVISKYKIDSTDKKVKIAFIGNSLTLHSKLESIGWNHTSGMAASSLENDYVHKTVKKLAESKNVNIEYALINLADWEREFENFDINRLQKIWDFEPEYIIFQFGENVSQEDVITKKETFYNEYIKIIESFGKSNTKIICLPFWHSNEKNQLFTKAAIETKSFIIDLSHLGNGLDKKNYASSEINYKNQGVGMHPGDYGMENISDIIFSVLNVIVE